MVKDGAHMVNKERRKATGGKKRKETKEKETNDAIPNLSKKKDATIWERLQQRKANQYRRRKKR